MCRPISVNSCSLDSFEGLRQAIHGSHVEVMQLGRGKFRGLLSHVSIGDFSLSIGSFSVGVRNPARADRRQAHCRNAALLGRPASRTGLLICALLIFW